MSDDRAKLTTKDGAEANRVGRGEIVTARARARRWRPRGVVPATGMRLAAVVVVAVIVGTGIVVASPAFAAPPSNDDIASASPIAALPFTATQDSLEATQAPSDPSPTCGTFHDFTVWYSFTPTSSGSVSATTTGGDYFPPLPTVYSGPLGATSSSVLTEVACSQSGTVQLNVTAGSTYYFMLGSYSPRPSFTFEVQTVVPPVNDDISQALPVTTLPFTATQDISHATSDPGDPSPSCASGIGFTVWYSYTAPVEETVAVGGQTAATYVGPPAATSSSPLTELGCPFAGPMQLALSAGKTYYFLLGSSVPATAATFTLTTIAAPANDDIALATPVTALPFTATQDTILATRAQSDPSPTCGAPHDFTVWYSFTPAANSTVQASTSGGDYFPPTPTAYSGPVGATAASTLAEVSCSSSGAVQLNVTAGTTYYFMVGSYSPRPTFTFAIQTVVPSANDDIADASPVAALPFTATQDSLNATQAPSDPTPSCSAPRDFTVWYSFTPTSNGRVQASASGGDFFPPTPTAYSGPAGATSTSPLTEVACSRSGAVRLDVTAGTTYYFMLGSYTPRPSFTFDVASVAADSPPVIIAPPVEVGNDPGLCGASVTYPGLAVSGEPPPYFTVVPTPGSFFAVGSSTASVYASNSAGTVSSTFPVTVHDTEGPTVTAPSSVVVDATDPAGAVVTYPAFTASDNCPGVAISSVPASGSRFPIGDTVVTGTATDGAGTRVSSTFVVHVRGAGEQLADLSTSVKGVGRGSSLQVTVAVASALLSKGHVSSTCAVLGVFDLQVRLQTPRYIPLAQAAALIADARRIASVLGCSHRPPCHAPKDG